MGIFVTNNSGHELVDAWNGKQFIFPVGGTIEIDEIVARHIFGYGADDKINNLVRLGWVHTNTDIPNAIERLGKFMFSTENKPSRSLDPASNTDAPVSDGGGKRAKQSTK